MARPSPVLTPYNAHRCGGHRVNAAPLQAARGCSRPAARQRALRTRRTWGARPHSQPLRQRRTRSGVIFRPAVVERAGSGAHGACRQRQLAEAVARPQCHAAVSFALAAGAEWVGLEQRARRLEVERRDHCVRHGVPGQVEAQGSELRPVHAARRVSADVGLQRLQQKVQPVRAGQQSAAARVSVTVRVVIHPVHWISGPARAGIAPSCHRFTPAPAQRWRRAQSQLRGRRCGASGSGRSARSAPRWRCLAIL